MAGIYNFLCLVTIAIVFNNVIAVNYCDLSSCAVKRSHTMCKYFSSRPARACGNSYSVGLSDADKKIIVDTHNKLRQKVASGQETKGQPGPQPPAISMPDLTWDNELAEIAQRWAIQCNFNHDTCRNVDRFAVGQNIVQTYSSGENKSTLQSMILLWYNEVAHFNKNDIQKYHFDRNTGHYTQIVWAKTTKIGCGSINYKNGGWNAKYLVCNYGPSGNYIGQKIYEIKK